MFILKKQYVYLLSLFCAIGFIIGIILSKYIALVSIFFSNIFTAYSDAKIVVFLAYSALAFITAYFCLKPLIPLWNANALVNSLRICKTTFGT